MQEKVCEKAEPHSNSVHVILVLFLSNSELLALRDLVLPRPWIQCDPVDIFRVLEGEAVQANANTVKD